MTATAARTALLLHCVLAALSLNVEDVAVIRPGWFPRQAGVGEPLGVRKGVVNLDLPPMERWKPIIHMYRDDIVRSFGRWNRVLDFIPHLDQQAWSKALGKKMPVALFEEVYSIVKILNHSAVTDANLMLLNAMYEIGAPVKSTGMLVASDLGKVTHGHSQAEDIATPIVEVTFRRRDAPVFTAPMFLGSVGVHAAVKAGRWSFSQEAERPEMSPAGRMQRALESLQRQGQIASILARELMEKDIGYKGAADRLAVAPLVGGQTLLVGGPGSFEGLAIPRSSNPAFGKTGIQRLDSMRRHLLQSGNTDAVQFRAAAISPRKQSVGKASLIDTLKNIGAEYAAFTFVMSPEDGESCAFNREHDECASKNQKEPGHQADDRGDTAPSVTQLTHPFSKVAWPKHGYSMRRSADGSGAMHPPSAPPPRGRPWGAGPRHPPPRRGSAMPMGVGAGALVMPPGRRLGKGKSQLRGDRPGLAKGFHPAVRAPRDNTPWQLPRATFQKVRTRPPTDNTPGQQLPRATFQKVQPPPPGLRPGARRGDAGFPEKPFPAPVRRHARPLPAQRIAS